jgi:hypothetical protein
MDGEHRGSGGPVAEGQGGGRANGVRNEDVRCHYGRCGRANNHCLLMAVHLAITNLGKGTTVYMIHPIGASLILLVTRV